MTDQFWSFRRSSPFAVLSSLITADCTSWCQIVSTIICGALTTQISCSWVIVLWRCKAIGYNKPCSNTMSRQSERTRNQASMCSFQGCVWWLLFASHLQSWWIRSMPCTTFSIYAVYTDVNIKVPWDLTLEHESCIKLSAGWSLLHGTCHALGQQVRFRYKHFW